MARQPSIVHVIVISILFVALIITLLLYFDIHEDVLRFLDWLDAAWCKYSNERYDIVIEQY